MSIITHFTPFYLDENVALHHSHIWQCNGIEGLKLAFMSSN